jgi:hypothetical protein
MQNTNYIKSPGEFVGDGLNRNSYQIINYNVESHLFFRLFALTSIHLCFLYIYSHQLLEIVRHRPLLGLSLYPDLRSGTL